MKSDLSLMIDDIKLNIRVGIIFRYNNKTLIEVLKSRKGNSVIPGGRVKIDELSIDSLKREMMEEMHFSLVDEKLSFIMNKILCFIPPPLSLPNFLNFVGEVILSNNILI